MADQPIAGGAPSGASLPHPEERRAGSEGPGPAASAANGRASPSPSITAALNGSPNDTPFGASLEPVLREACGGRLSAVSWFRTDWQRGGAATGYAVFICDDGREQAVVVKLPVPPMECAWLERLKHVDHIVPWCYASGQTLGGYDIAWVVMERLPHGPLGPLWGGREFDLLTDAAGRFYQATREFPVDVEAPATDWQHVCEQARRNIHDHELADDEQRWKNVLKKVHKKLRGWLEMWDGRATDTWCHGDLHLANAMTRAPAPDGPAVLLDLGSTHAGHWVEDAVYFEHLFWARRQRLGGRRLCSQIAHERKKHGLPVEADWPRLASIKRCLMAVSTAAMVQADGDRRHVHAALEVLENEA